MGTSKPLKDLIPDIMEHFSAYRDYLEFNYRIFKIMEGQLKEEVMCSVKREVLSPGAYNRIIERIPPINVLRKATDKLSKIYVEKPTRLCNDRTDLDIFDNIQRISGVDREMMKANMFYNSQHSFAIEPYIKDRNQQFRVLAAHQFLPFSDDISDPNNMTVFIKMMGREVQQVEAEYSKDGRLLREEFTREVQIMGLYSDTEFLIIDSEGAIREDRMSAMGLTSTKHDFGVIPFLYKSRTNNQLIPFPNQEGFDMSVLIPKLLADLNYASQFLSKSIIWVKNAKIDGQELNPDTVVDLGEGPEDGAQPEMGTIDPKVDIPNQLKLVEFQIMHYLASIGIKASSAIKQGEEASGVSKSIDEGDTTAEKKVQTEFFRCVEHEMWDLMSIIQNKWARNNLVNENRTFSPKFADSVRIQFAEMKATKSDRQKLDEIQMWRDQKLMTRKQALRTLRPEFTESQIDQWISELDEEDEENMEKMLEGGMGIGPDRTSDGTFNEGNQAQKNDPEKRLEAEEDKFE